MNHSDVIQTISTATQDLPAIRGLFLSGSYGNGLSDAYSDIDFILVTPEGATDGIAEIWKDAISQTGEIVLWWDRQTVPVLINAITADWTRTDVLILKPEQLAPYAKDKLKPLFDHDGLYATLSDTSKVLPPNPQKFLYQVEEFIRILGLMPLAAGRGEYNNGVLGVSLLRNLLVDLMITQTNAPHRGGILHLNRLLTTEQKDALTALPPAIAEHGAMIATNLAYAKEYLPRARAWAKEIGTPWPERFEEVTWQQLKTTLSIDRPYTPS